MTAFSTPSRPDWRWRIVSYAGEVVEESRDTFPTIATAVEHGRRRLQQMNVVDRPAAPQTFRTTSHLRSRRGGAR